jgi:hypothetical protein
MVGDQNKSRGLCVSGSDGTTVLGCMSRTAGGHGCSAQGSTSRAKSSADGKTHLHFASAGHGVCMLLVRMRSRAHQVLQASCPPSRAWMNKAITMRFSPPGLVCLPLMPRRPYSSFTKPALNLPRLDAPPDANGVGNSGRTHSPTGANRRSTGCRGGMRDTVIQHHHGKHSIGTLEPRIADLRNAAGIVTRGVVRFRQVFDGLPFPMRRRESRSLIVPTAQCAVWPRTTIVRTAGINYRGSTHHCHL